MSVVGVGVCGAHVRVCVRMDAHACVAMHVLMSVCRHVCLPNLGVRSATLGMLSGPLGTDLAPLGIHSPGLSLRPAALVRYAAALGNR